MRLVIALGAVCGSVFVLHSQPKPLTPADYGQFESLGAGTLSPDGKWLSYAINRSNRENELRFTNLASGDVKVAAFGMEPAFSSDSQWLAHLIGLPEAQEEKLKKEKKPVHRKLGIWNLAKGALTTIDDIESFSFSPNSCCLAMRRYAPDKPQPASPAPVDDVTDKPPVGTTLIVRQLTTGRDFTFGNVSEYAWQDLPKSGRLLATSISVEDKTGNGIQLFDPESGSIRVLDSGAAIFSGLVWRKKTSDLAVLRSHADDQHENPTHFPLAWKGLGTASETAYRFDTAKAGAVPGETRIVAYRKPSWSDDGTVVFLGYSKWQRNLPPKQKLATESKDVESSASKDVKEPEDQPTVDIWHWRDADVMPKQKIGAKSDRERNMLAAWHLAPNRFVPLGQSLTEEVRPIKQSTLAAVNTWTTYAMDRSIGRPFADLSFVDIATGKRDRIKDKIRDDQFVQLSSGGRYVFYLQDDHYWTIDTRTRTVVNITQKVPTSFIDRESDFTTKQKPPFGVAGWTKDDTALLLYDEFDIWQISPDGTGFKKLTDGAAQQVRHRYVRLDPEAEFIDPTKPLYVSLFGLRTKKSGYGRIRSGKFESLCWDDKMIGRLTKAREAETYAYTNETFEKSPNFFVSGGDLKDPKRVTNTNPFQEKYSWGHSELIDYKDSLGRSLQGALYYPADFERGKKYPMVVYLYERLSDNLHRFAAPSQRDYYNAGAVTSSGYMLLMPDIVFRPREAGVSVVECVSAAVNAVLAKGDVDAKRIGVMGHSWGGFDASYLATHSNLFAAAVAGAPITNLVSNYGNHHWKSGIAETDHIETGQQRMEVPLWEDLPAYVRNSATFNVQNMTTPLLIEVGDIDGTVFFHQGVELYNIARRSGKSVVLLVYAGEDHSLQKKANQIDYQQRILAWFSHYLKGEPAQAWITEGESYLQRQDALKALKAATAAK